MSKVKRSWEVLTDNQKQAFLREIIGYFKKERDEIIGLIAAEEILDFFQEKLSPPIYNTALDDAKKMLKARFQDLEVDIDLLAKK